jgi:cytochrome c
MGLAALLALTGPAMADTADAVQALVERAGLHIKAVGRTRAFADITNAGGGFVDGGLYVFCIDADGISLAHGGNPGLVGKNLSNIRDSDGTLTTIGLYDVGQTQGRGWFEYRWPNPEARRIQRKVTFVLRIDERTVCASGYYKPDPP